MQRFSEEEHYMWKDFYFCITDDDIEKLKQGKTLYGDVNDEFAVILKYYEVGKSKALEQEPKMGHCKDCKYFEYDSVAKVDGIPLIVAHEICSKWGDGCKTKEDGYCFLFEPQEESEVEE